MEFCVSGSFRGSTSLSGLALLESVFKHSLSKMHFSHSSLYYWLAVSEFVPFLAWQVGSWLANMAMAHSCPDEMDTRESEAQWGALVHNHHHRWALGVSFSAENVVSCTLAGNNTRKVAQCLDQEIGQKHQVLFLSTVTFISKLEKLSELSVKTSQNPL